MEFLHIAKPYFLGEQVLQSPELELIAETAKFVVVQRFRLGRVKSYLCEFVHGLRAQKILRFEP